MVVPPLGCDCPLTIVVILDITSFVIVQYLDRNVAVLVPGKVFWRPICLATDELVGLTTLHVHEQLPLIINCERIIHYFLVNPVEYTV